MVDPFTATTMAVDTGGNVLINPSFNAYTNFTTGYVSAEWLLTNEQPSESDGPLTSAAITASVAGNINANLLGSYALLKSGSLAPGATTGAISLANVGAIGISVFAHGSGSSPVNDTCDMQLDWLNSNNIADILYSEFWSQWCSLSTSKLIGTTMIDIIPPIAPFLNLTLNNTGSGTQTAIYKIWSVPLAASFERPMPATLARYSNVTVLHNLGAAPVIIGANSQNPVPPTGVTWAQSYSPGSIDLAMFSTDTTQGNGVVILNEWVGGGTLAFQERARQVLTDVLPSFGITTKPWRFNISRTTMQMNVVNLNGVTDRQFFGSASLVRE